jgi:hypothetical protein
MAEYCGLGLSDGEQLPPLEELDLVEYPWGNRQQRTLRGSSGWGDGVIRYPGKGAEEDYWAHHFDWSRLRRLAAQDASLAHRITQKLTSLNEVSFRPDFRFRMVYPQEELPMTRFLEDVPTTLDSITIPNLTPLSTTTIIRHGSRLRKLELLRGPTHNGQPTASIASSEDLTRLREGLPQLQELAIDVVNNRDDWPYDKLDILASFPRLRSVILSFEFAKPQSEVEAPARPYLTMASAESLFGYMREHSTAEPPSLQHLHLCSDGPSSDSWWGEPNSTSFVCELGCDAGGQREVTVTCPKLNKELNEKMRRVVRGVETPSLAEMSKIDFTVALHGPLSISQLKVMRITDPGPDIWGP